MDKRATYDPKTIFAEEWAKMLGLARSAEADAQWRLFVDQSQAPMLAGGRVYGELPVAIFRRLALAWCVRARAEELHRQAESMNEQWKRMLNKALLDVRVGLPDDACAVYDVERAVICEHDCAADPDEKDSGGKDMASMIGDAVKGLLGQLGVSIADVQVQRVPQPDPKAKSN